MKNEEENFEWDRRRIIFGIFICIFVVAMFFEVKNRFFPNVSILGTSTVRKSTPVEKPSVKPPNFNIASGVGSKISEIKQNISGLDAKEIASSSPQIQKVLHDIQGIRDLPANQAKEMCLKICSGI